MLSIVIPTLNEAAYILFLLDSIKKQNFRDYEIIVVDAGSVDKTADFLKLKGYKVISLDSSAGFPARARNIGAESAQGQLVLFLDGDSVLPGEDFLQKTLEEFEERKLDAAGFPLLPYNKNFIFRLAYNLFYNWYPALAFEKSLPHAANAILVKKEIHQKLGGFDEEIKIAEDHAYVREAGKIGKFGIIKSLPLYVLTKRFDCDGWIKTNLKFLLCELRMTFFGPVKSDIFKYRFGHFNQKKNSLTAASIFWWLIGFPILFLTWVFTVVALLIRGVVKWF
jgi:glycosyltransferase involved in cell wall biosynthesis